MKHVVLQRSLRGFLAVLILSMFGYFGCAESNGLPVIERLTVEKDWVAPSGNCEIECLVSDADGDSLTYDWSATGGTITGTDSNIIWTAPQTVGTYDINLEVVDGRGGKVAVQLPVEVRANSLPVIESLVAERPVANRGESILIECGASDADDDGLSYAWSATEGTIQGTGPTVIWLAPYIPGTYEITVEVEDGRGGKAESRLPLEVGVNHPPVVESLTADPPSVGQTESSTIECIASDPDGDELTYLWEADDGEFSGEGFVVTWISPDECKACIISVTVADGRGGEIVRRVYVTVKKPG